MGLKAHSMEGVEGKEETSKKEVVEMSDGEDSAAIPGLKTYSICGNCKRFSEPPVACTHGV